nr:MAG TPA: hypothetical protein [Caudoviricetes sp.]
MNGAVSARCNRVLPRASHRMQQSVKIRDRLSYTYVRTKLRPPLNRFG